MITTLIFFAVTFAAATAWRWLAERRRRRRDQWNVAKVYALLAEDDRRRIAETQERAAQDAVRPNGHVDNVTWH